MTDNGPLIGENRVAWRVYTEDWDPAYGNPATFDWDDSEQVEQAESGVGHVRGSAAVAGPVGVVAGRRRAELSLWLEDESTGQRVPGLLGAYAVGAVTIRPGRSAS